MSLLVVGSVALDSIETPHGSVRDILGGSATFISSCAVHFTKPVRLVGVVGDDFPSHCIDYLKSKEIDLEGLQIRKGEKTFRWGGRYDANLSGRETLFTELNAFQTFDPDIPAAYRDSAYVCLGNIDPDLQLRVLDQIEQPRMVVGDTMNFWIEGKNEALRKTIKRLDVLIISDSEARQLSGIKNLIKAGRAVLAMGPKALIIKKGEHGAVLMTKEVTFSAPAYPLEDVHDPTGAGDAFAGGFIGWIAQTDNTSIDNLKSAVIYGNVMASFCIQKFSVDGLKDITGDMIRERVRTLYELTHFEIAED